MATGPEITSNLRVKIKNYKELLPNSSWLLVLAVPWSSVFACQFRPGNVNASGISAHSFNMMIIGTDCMCSYYFLFCFNGTIQVLIPVFRCNFLATQSCGVLCSCSARKSVIDTGFVINYLITYYKHLNACISVVCVINMHALTSISTLLRSGICVCVSRERAIQT